MSYDLYFFKLPEARSAAEYFQDTDWENPDSFDSSLLIDIRKVTNDVLSLNIGFEEFQKDFAEISKATGLSLEEAQKQFAGIELNTRELEEAPMQLYLDPSCITMTFPYWDFSPQSIATIHRYWAGVMPVLLQDLVGFDPQSECEVSESSFDEMMKGIVDTATAALKALNESRGM